jgi:two-component system, NarL family, response regulator
METENPIRIMIVDDHPMVREGLVSRIEKHEKMVVVAEAENGEQAIELFRQHKPDITLMDLRLPGMNGLEVISKIKEEYPEARFIVLTSYGSEEQIYKALKLGAKGYVLKDVVGEQLLEIIQTVHMGHSSFSENVLFSVAERTGRPNITSRELEVLNYIAKGASNKDIANALCISEETVRFHMKNILQKFRVKDRTHAVIVAIQKGLITVD